MIADKDALVQCEVFTREPPEYLGLGQKLQAACVFCIISEGLLFTQKDVVLSGTRQQVYPYNITYM